MDSHYIWISILLLVSSTAVGIQELRIPSAIEVGSKNMVKDCHYNLTEGWSSKGTLAGLLLTVDRQATQPQLIHDRFQG